MLRRATKQQQATERRAALLDAVVIRNQAVREESHADGLRLTATMRRSRLAEVLGARTPPKKSFALDALGTFVWHGIDGRRSVEDCIRRFADEKRVNIREAEVAVLAFLKMLTQRGLIAMVARANLQTPK